MVKKVDAPEQGRCATQGVPNGHDRTQGQAPGGLQPPVRGGGGGTGGDVDTQAKPTEEERAENALRAILMEHPALRDRVTEIVPQIES